MAPKARRGVVDNLVLFGLAVAVLAAFGARPLWKSAPDGGDVVVRIVAAAVVAAVYYGVWMTRSNGSTAGKALAGLRVLRLDGLRMTPGRAVWRESIVKIALIDLAGLVAGATGVASLLVVLDIAWALGNAQRRALHDLAAGTRVTLADAERRDRPDR